MAKDKDYQRIITVRDITVYENNKYYLVRSTSKDSDDIYPKKDWTLKEVLKDTGISIPEDKI